MDIIIENPKEVKSMLGLELYKFEILTMEKYKKDNINEEPYCADQEIFMEFSNGKEMRIYIDKDGDLCVYTD